MTIAARLIAAAFALVAALAPAQAQIRGTLDEAQAMAEAAAAFLAAEGPAVAYPAFDTSPAWHDRDLYVFVVDGTGLCLSHGARADLIGQNIIDLRDRNGLAFVPLFLAVTERGWVDYVWTNPVTGAEEPKRTYIVRLGDLAVGVGAYVP